MPFGTRSTLQYWFLFCGLSLYSDFLHHWGLICPNAFLEKLSVFSSFSNVLVTVDSSTQLQYCCATNHPKFNNKPPTLAKQPSLADLWAWLGWAPYLRICHILLGPTVYPKYVLLMVMAEVQERSGNLLCLVRPRLKTDTLSILLISQSKSHGPALYLEWRWLYSTKRKCKFTWQGALI